MLFRALSQTFLQPAVSVLKKNRQIALISTQKAFFLQYSRFLLKKINKFRSFNSQKRSFLQPALLLLKNRKVSGPSHPIFAGVLFTYTAPTIKCYCFNFPGTFSLMVDIHFFLTPPPEHGGRSVLDLAKSLQKTPIPANFLPPGACPRLFSLKSLQKTPIPANFLPPRACPRLFSLKSLQKTPIPANFLPPRACPQISNCFLDTAATIG